MLCDSKRADDCSILQINSPINYLRYHLVSLIDPAENVAAELFGYLSHNRLFNPALAISWAREWLDW